MFIKLALFLFLFFLFFSKLVKRLVRRFIWMPIWYFVYFFLCRPKTLIFTVLLSVWAITYNWGHINDYIQYQMKQADVPKEQRELALKFEKVTSLPPITGEVQNGDSMFAEDILARFNEHQMKSYNKEFSEVIVYGEDNKSYGWKVSDKTFGMFTPGKRYTAKNGIICRPYAELISIRGLTQKKYQRACRYVDSENWCSLPLDAIESCEIGYGTQSEHTYFKIKNYLTDW